MKFIHIGRLHLIWKPKPATLKFVAVNFSTTHLKHDEHELNKLFQDQWEIIDQFLQEGCVIFLLAKNEGFGF